MAECVQTSTPQFKRCPKCGEIKARAEFFKNKNRPGGWSSWCKICLSDNDKTEKAREAQKKYRILNKDKIKIKQYRYMHSEKGQETRHKYSLYWRKTEKGKLCRQRFLQSEKGRIMQRKSDFKRYYTSEKRKNWIAEYKSQPGFRENYRIQKNNRYYYLQDRFGCHSEVAAWYPAARLIEALETAPIVEIKV